MNGEKMKYFNKKDLIIIASILVFAVTMLIYNNSKAELGTQAYIYYDNELVKIVDLTKHEDYTFRVKENENVLFHVYEDGSIAFVESTCRDKICINSGRHSKVGDTAACLPNKMVLKIVGEDQEVDTIISN